MPHTKHAVILAATVLAIGCKAKLTSDVSIDGKQLELDACRSGQAFGFSGVDLVDKSGTKLRLVAMPSGETNALIFASGAAQGTDLGACGPLQIERQNSQINDIYNVKGTATLDCTDGKSTVKGSVSFENCH